MTASCSCLPGMIGDCASRWEGGLEGALPDAVAKHIIADIVAPHLRSGDFAGGVEAGVDAHLRPHYGRGLTARLWRKRLLAMPVSKSYWCSASSPPSWSVAS
jgi:hypothetical protein